MFRKYIKLKPDWTENPNQCLTAYATMDMVFADQIRNQTIFLRDENAMFTVSGSV